MTSLFVDASLNYCNLVIIRNNKVVKYISVKTNNNLTDLVVEHIDKLLVLTHLKQTDIKRLLVVVGPGSFTGIRVASIIAKTWNFVHQIPIYTIDSLRLQLLDNNGISLIDAKGKNWYITIRMNDKLIIKPLMIHEDELKQIIKKYSHLKMYTNYENADIFQNVIRHLPDFKLVQDINKLVPLYIKKAV